MSQSLEIVKSAVQLPHKRVRHTAVTWKNATIVYGGYACQELQNDNLSVLFFHKSGKWTKKHTYGDFPTWSQHHPRAQVVNDKMFVFETDNGNMFVHSLDLHTWRWEKLAPNGTLPFGIGSSSITSWVYDGKIYCFGGYKYPQGASNQLFCYNITTNSWEWPYAGGDIPSPRLLSSVILSEETVFLFGGISDGNITYNDLYTLDMASMVWRRVHGNLSIGEGPTKMRFFTFTCISQSKALLLVGRTSTRHHIPINNSWLMNLHNAKQLMAPSSIWTNVPNHPSKCCHAAVLQPLSKTLWVMGGHDGNSCYFNCLDVGAYTNDVLKVKLSNLRPLKDLAIEQVTRSISANDPRLAPGQLPAKLMEEIEAYRSENGIE